MAGAAEEQPSSRCRQLPSVQRSALKPGWPSPKAASGTLTGVHCPAAMPASNASPVEAGAPSATAWAARASARVMERVME